MKNLLLFGTLLLIFSCSESPESSDNETAIDNPVIADTTQTDSSSLGVDIYTAEAAIDGPEEELWIFQPGQWDGEVTSPVPDSFEELHVIPFQGKGNEVQKEMSFINKSRFHTWGPDENFSGPVTIYYDKNKSKVAAQFNVVKSEPNGVASIYYPDGTIFIQERYSNGNLTEAIVYPYSVDWTFSQKESKLWVKDPISKGSKNSKGQDLHKISYSVREKEPGDNEMVNIMEKESFSNPFEINDELFTGTLMAYDMPSGIERENPYFELNFKEGWLHGDIKVYNWWGDLKLHEVFVDGVLDTTIYVMDESEMDGLAKPIIYLYPEKEQKISVELDIKGDLTHSYPTYNSGWNVMAEPDGTLHDIHGKEYYALYWEANNERQFNVKDGFVVPGNQTAEFLESSLEILGLNRREANEFIVFWLPVLENNPYNLIHFSSTEYEDMARLRVVPEPETIIRVMMVYKPLQSPISIPVQDLSKLKKERNGFTVVEWGGSLLKGSLAL